VVVICGGDMWWSGRVKVLRPRELCVGARGKSKLTLGSFDKIRGWYSIKPASRVGERRW